MKYLLLGMILTNSAYAKVDGIEFKEDEVHCIQSIDRVKLHNIANQLDIWSMSKANREIILSQIVAAMVLDCLEEKYK